MTELKPTQFGVKPFNDSRVYPKSGPDEYGQTSIADKDRSRLGQFPSPSDEAHYRSDVDAAQKSLHHTLGPNQTQSAPGNHQHDGTTSRKIGPLQMNTAFNPALPEGPTNLKRIPVWTCANTTTAIRALLHNFLEFTDV